MPNGTCNFSFRSSKAEALRRRWSTRLSECGKAKAVRLAQGAERPKGDFRTPHAGSVLKALDLRFIWDR